VNVQIVPSSIGDKTQHVLASYLVNDVVAVDAGALGLISPLEVQSRITHVFLSHSHLDHIASLPLFVDHVYKTRSSCVTIYASEATQHSLKTDIFNDRVWPDMVRLSEETTPFLKLEPLENEQAVEVGEVAVTPVSLEHTVPTFGFLVGERNAAVAIVSDTAPTQRIWDVVNQTPNLKAVFLEVSFPESMRWLAETSRHLTSLLFLEEVRKIHRDVRIIAVHLKPAYRADILRELDDVGIPNLEVGMPGETYAF